VEKDNDGNEEGRSDEIRGSRRYRRYRQPVYTTHITDGRVLRALLTNFIGSRGRKEKDNINTPSASILLIQYLYPLFFSVVLFLPPYFSALESLYPNCIRWPSLSERIRQVCLFKVFPVQSNRLCPKPRVVVFTPPKICSAESA